MSNRFVYGVPYGLYENLYSSDGTAVGTADLNVAAFGYNTDEQPIDFTTFNNRLYFLGFASGATLPGYGGIGSTDGTPSGTTFAYIGGPDTSFIPTGLGVANGHLLASGSAYGSDGTLASQNLYASTDGSTFTSIKTGVDLGTAGIVNSGNVGYFNSPNVTGSTPGLWCTDGTASGTYQVFASTPAQSLGDITSLGGGKAAFAVQNSDETYSLYVTDGSTSGAHLITKTALGTNIVVDSGSASTGSKAVFSAIDAAGNISTWATDGTSSGTVELLINGPSGDMVRTPGDYIQSGNKVAFDTGYGVYVTDGTKKGTVQIPSIESDGSLAVAGGKVFSLEGGGSVSFLVVSDGTIKGTTRIQVAGLQSPDPGLTAAGNGVVFSGTDASGHDMFFTSDGTAAGTHETTLSVEPGKVLSGLPVSAPTPYTMPDGNQFYAAPVNTVVQAGNGNDTVSALAGNVTVDGGQAGSTLLFFGGSAPSAVFAPPTGTATILGGSDGGTYDASGILVSQGASGANTTLSGGAAGTEFFGSAKGNDTMTLGTGSETAVGGGGNTTITGGLSKDASDVIFTGSGITSVTGSAGGYDTIVAGSGHTTVTTTAVGKTVDAIFGGTGSLDVTANSTAADSIVGSSGSTSVTGAGGNMLVVAGTAASTINIGNGASLVFTNGQTTVTGGTGSMQAVLGAGSASITEGAGPASYDVVKGSAAGTDMLSGFKVGTDSINLFGYVAGDVHVSTGSGNTLVSLSDGTKIEILGVTNLGGSLVV